MTRLIATIAAVCAAGLLGCGSAGTGTGSGEPVDSQSAAISVHGTTSGSDGVAGMVFLYLQGHQRCPRIASYSDGEAFDAMGNSLGSAQEVGLQDGQAANAGGGGNDISEDAFFNNVALGPFTICARPTDDLGVCLQACNTARGFGRARAAHKTHVDLVMTCRTPPTQDVGAVVSVQNTPSIDLTGAVETGLAGCGGSDESSLLTASGQIISPDGTATEYRASTVGPAPAGVVISPSDWTAAAGGAFSVSGTNSSGAAASADIKIEARLLGLDGRYIYARPYTLNFSWRECL